MATCMIWIRDLVSRTKPSSCSSLPRTCTWRTRSCTWTARDSWDVGPISPASRIHPYTSPPRTPAAAAGTLIALDAALGLGDYYDIGALYSDELGSADFYYRLLNAGFRIPATAGTDNFSDVWRDPPPGSDRTFARVEGPLTMRS